LEPVVVMEWPALDPDLNPIREYGKRLQAMERRPNHLNQVTGALLDIWGNVDQNDIRNLILSMSDRCQAVINATEDNTRFKENNL
jgi:hypothetical protein